MIVSVYFQFLVVKNIFRANGLESKLSKVLPDVSPLSKFQ
jgi:hypothetical protein